jgi:hypothetical protein
MDTRSSLFNAPTVHGSLASTELLQRELKLIEWLSSAGDVNAFIKRVTRALAKISVSNWGYSRLDVPPDLGIEGLIGTDFNNYTDSYTYEAFYECDMTLQHVLSSDSSVFQSNFHQMVEECSLSGEILLRNRELFRMTRSYGFEDYFNLPISSIDGGRAVFCICCKGSDIASFRENVSSNIQEINLIAKVTDEIGVSRFSKYILNPKTINEKIISSRGLKLLQLMHTEHVSQKVAASMMHITERTAARHSAKIRELLGVTNSRDAIMLSLRRGYIIDSDIEAMGETEA